MILILMRQDQPGINVIIDTIHYTYKITPVYVEIGIDREKIADN